MSEGKQNRVHVTLDDGDEIAVCGQEVDPETEATGDKGCVECADVLLRMVKVTGARLLAVSKIADINFDVRFFDERKF